MAHSAVLVQSVPSHVTQATARSGRDERRQGEGSTLSRREGQWSTIGGKHQGMGFMGFCAQQSAADPPRPTASTDVGAHHERPT